MLGFTTFLLPILPAPSEKTSPILLFSPYSQHPFPEKVRGPLSTSAMTPTFLPNLSAHPFQASYGEVSRTALCSLPNWESRVRSTGSISRADRNPCARLTLRV